MQTTPAPQQIIFYSPPPDYTHVATTKPPYHYHHHHYPIYGSLGLPPLPLYDYFYPLPFFRSLDNLTVHDNLVKQSRSYKSPLRRRVKPTKISKKRLTSKVQRRRIVKKKIKRNPLSVKISNIKKGARERQPSISSHQNKRQRKRKVRRRKRRKISFRRTFSVPGKTSKLYVSSRDVMHGLTFRYNGKSYNLTLRQIRRLLRGKVLKNSVKKSYN